MIEKHIGQSISKEELPVNKAVNAHEEEYFWHRMLRATKNPEAGNHSDEFYKHLAGKFLSEHTAVDLVATFLRLLDEPTPKFEIVNTGFENQHHNKKTDTKTRNNKGYISKKNNIPAQLNETVIIEQPLGKSGGYTSKQIVDYIIAHSSLTENLIGDIEVNNSSCYIEIPMDRVDEVYSVFHNMNRNGRNASSSLPRARARYGRNS
jgi:ATP-dependent RNA helicase DeaD